MGRTGWTVVVGQLTAHAYLWMNERVFFLFLSWDHIFTVTVQYSRSVPIRSDPIRSVWWCISFAAFLLEPKGETTIKTHTHTLRICVVSRGRRRRLFRPFAHTLLLYPTYRSSLLLLLLSVYNVYIDFSYSLLQCSATAHSLLHPALVGSAPLSDGVNRSNRFHRTGMDLCESALIGMSRSSSRSNSVDALCQHTAQQGTDSSALPLGCFFAKKENPLSTPLPSPKIDDDDDDEENYATPSPNDDEPAVVNWRRRALVLPAANLTSSSFLHFSAYILLRGEAKGSFFKNNIGHQ